MAPHYFPILVNIEGQACTVIGGGEVALRKVENLLAAGARVTVISPELNAGLARLKAEGAFTHVERDLGAGDLAGARLAVAATDDARVQDAALNEAREHGVLINVVDQPEKCSFIVPAVVRQGDLILAVSTSGSSPALAASLRRQLERQFGPEYKLLTALLANLRKRLLAEEPDRKKREALFKKLAESQLAELIKRKEFADAEKLLREITSGRFGFYDLKP